MDIPFHKGHGTRNDFILIEDTEGMRELTPALVRELADRRGGIGGDGVIRVVRAGAMPGWTGDPGLWFMDYWNADGSVAEMCGNGLRVFARFLQLQQLVDQAEFEVATRAGLKRVFLTAGGVEVGIGAARVDEHPIIVHLEGHEVKAYPVDVGNPHAVAFVDTQVLRGAALDEVPTWTPRERFPQGVNVELVTVDSDDDLTMRVFERGVGETESCGTGVVAAVAAHRKIHGGDGPVCVHVPGGDLVVSFADGEATLRGPAVIVAHGHYRAE